MKVELEEGITIIENERFANCNIKSINITSSVKVIGIGAFHNCKQLVEVTLCDGLEIIDTAAFVECTSLKSVAIPSTVKTIGKGAFEKCEQFVEVTLCDGLETIDGGAFNECTSLKSVAIPSTVKTIGKEERH